MPRRSYILPVLNEAPGIASLLQQLAEPAKYLRAKLTGQIEMGLLYRELGRVEALEERARLLLSGDRPEAAMDDLATVCREAPERTDAMRRLAALYREHDRHEALVTLYEMQLQRRPGVDKIEPLIAKLNDFADEGLRLVEVDRLDLVDVPEIIDHLEGTNARYVIYCDDL